MFKTGSFLCQREKEEKKLQKKEEIMLKKKELRWKNKNKLVAISVMVVMQIVSFNFVSFFLTFVLFFFLYERKRKKMLIDFKCQTEEGNSVSVFLSNKKICNQWTWKWWYSNEK